MTFSREKYLELASNSGLSELLVEKNLSYADTLATKGLPVIFDRQHLALMIGLSHEKLSWIIKGKVNFYGYFRLQKRKRGEYREIRAPKDDLKYIQRWIYFNILANVEPHQSCHGFRRGFSIKTNAEVHRERKFVLKIDLLKFFDTISARRVYGIFLQLGYEKAVASALAALCTVNHRWAHWVSNIAVHAELADRITPNTHVTPQGAPTSPMLANLVGRNLDKEISEITSKHQINYSRYADDLIFSSDFPMEFLKPILFRAITENGFFINYSKVKSYKRGQKQFVTGLTVTHGVHVSKKYRKEIWTHLYYAKKVGVIQHLKNLQDKGKVRRNIYSYQSWLFGRIAFVNSINKSIGQKMMQEYNRIDWAALLLKSKDS